MTVVYVDLSTFDELEEQLYGGSGAANIFHQRVTKVIWFAQVPIKLRNSGTADWGQTFTVSQPRNGDYASYTWARFTLPALTTSTAGYKIAWARDPGHSFFKEFSFLVNEVAVFNAKEASVHLDQASHHHVDEGHWDNYQSMIGNTDISVPAASIAAAVVDVPMWIFYQRNGYAFPHSCIPYADVKWEIQLRDFANVVQTQGAAPATVIADLTGVINSAVPLTKFELWTNYIVSTNDLRAQMGRVPRQMLIEQVQSTAAVMSTSADTTVDLRFSYAMKNLAWVAQNTSRSTTLIQGYVATAAGSTVYTAGYQYTNYTDDPDMAPGLDPILTTTIKYENALRLDTMPSDYFAQVVPFFHFQRSPKKVGFHDWALAYFASAANPSGSVNVSRLYNMSAVIAPITTLGNTYTTSAGGTATPTYRLVFLAYVHQVVLFTGGGLMLEFH